MAERNLRQPLEERELELAAREAELNRRESALRRAEEARADVDARGPAVARRVLRPRGAELEARIVGRLDRRERELERTIGRSRRSATGSTPSAASTSRAARRSSERTREVEAERDRLRAEQARLVTASMELDDRERAAAARSS